MLDTDVKACPAFVRWQIHCSKCGTTFYVDVDSGSTEVDILKLDEMKCQYHPNEDSVVMLV